MKYTSNPSITSYHPMCNSCRPSSNNVRYLIENVSTLDERLNCDRPCEIILGFYCFYDTVARSMECEEWPELCDLRKIVRTLKYTNFSVQSQRDTALSSIAALKVDAPFSLEVRFPDDKLYVNISCGAYSEILRQIAESLNFKDRETEVQSRYNPSKADPENQASRQKFGFDDALHAFHKGVEQVNRLLCTREEVYSRESFEKKYGLLWSPGRPRGPTYTDPCKDRRPPPPPPEKPPPSDKDTFAAAKYALRREGLDPHSFEFFADADMNSNPKCNAKTLTFTDVNDDTTPVGVDRMYFFTPSEYAKCGSGPVQAYAYSRLTGTLTRTTFSAVPSLDLDDSFTVVSSRKRKIKQKEGETSSF